MKLVPNFEPFKHQQEWLQKHWADEYHALYWAMGTGKTMPTILNAAELFVDARIDAVLVVTLNGVHRNWANEEIPKHMPPRIKYSCYYWGQAANKKVQAEQDLALEFGEETLRIVCMNIEALSLKRGRGTQFAAKFIKAHGGRVMFVLDEASTVKSRKATKTKIAIRLSNACDYRRILTGTPISQHPFDVWTQAEVLKKGLTNVSYYQFEHYFGKHARMVLGQRSFEKVVGYRNLDELKEMIGEWATIKTKEECLDLPPKLFQERYVPLTPDQVAAYRSMVELLSAEVGGQEFEAANALVALTRLHQIALGFISAGDEVKPIPSNRVSSLMSLLEETEGSVIIWCHSRPGIQLIIEALESEYPSQWVQYHGGISNDDREQAKLDFAAKKVRFFVGNPQTAGYGLTLTAATTVIYFSNSYKLEQRLQSEDRAHRIGQEHPVTYIDLVATGTVDEKVIKALKAKVDIERQVTGLVREWL